MRPLLTCFRKPDLDTVAAAWLLLPHGVGMLHAVRGEASDLLLRNANVLCLECGGSGQVALHNFDHHGGNVLPCATEQAWEFTGAPSRQKELVAYVSAVDTGTPAHSPRHRQNGLPLTALFSGMRLVHASLYAQFRMGWRMLHAVAQMGLPPEDVSPLADHDEEAARYRNAKLAARLALAEQARNAVRITETPLRVMALQSSLPGIHGLLRRHGADVSIAGTPDTGQWSISARSGLETAVRRIGMRLSALEPGWGGPAGGGIIGSPFGGSRLSLEELVTVIRSSFVAPSREPFQK